MHAYRFFPWVSAMDAHIDLLQIVQLCNLEHPIDIYIYIHIYISG